jgi:hypothetical protein
MPLLFTPRVCGEPCAAREAVRQGQFLSMVTLTLLLLAIPRSQAAAATVTTTDISLEANVTGQALALTNLLTQTSWLQSSSPLYTREGGAGITETLSIEALASGEIQLALTMTNPTTASLAATPTFPLLRGLNPGAGALSYCFPQMGRAGRSNAGTLRQSYGGNFPLQFIDVYNSAAGGIYIMTRDLSNASRSYWITKSNTTGNVSFGVDYASQQIAPGASWTLTAVIGAHTGDWHAALVAYRNWVKTWYTPLVPRKSWFQDVYNFRQIFLYPNSSISNSPAYDPVTQTYNFDALLAQDRAAFGGVDFVHLFDWSQTPTSGRVGDYTPWSYLGGVAAFSNQVAKIQAAGSPVGLYFEGYLLSKQSAVAPSFGPGWQLLSSNSQPYTAFGSGYYYPCPTVSTWTNYLAGRAVGAISNSTASGVYIDEFGFGWQYPCYNPAHAHPLPSAQSQAEGLMMRQIRAALPPATALYSEERGTDVTSQYQDGAFTYSIWSSSANDNPSLVNLARFALPDYKVFELIRVDSPLGNLTNEVKAVFFNGEGIWLEGPIDSTWFPSLVRQVITKTHGILRTYADAFRSSDPVPLVPTLRNNIYANQFPGDVRTVWTLKNTSSQPATGELLLVNHKPNARYYDVWNERLLTPRIVADSAYLTLSMAGRAAGCVVQQDYQTALTQDDRPVGYWRLNEAIPPATIATNLGSLGTAANGTYFSSGTAGGIPGAITGDPDEAVGFDGIASKVEIPFNAALNATIFSIECWVNPDTGALGQDMSVMDARAAESLAGYVFCATANPTNGRWEFKMGNGSGWDVLPGPLLVSNQWTHLVGTYDGTNQSLYANGALVASAPVNFLPNPSSPLRLGSGDPASGLNFSGGMDEVTVYTNALSPAQVLLHYLYGTTSNPPPVAPGIATGPHDQTVIVNQSVTLSAQVTGSLPLNYQWQFHGTNLPGQTGHTLALASAKTPDSGPYQIIVSNSAGTITSGVAVLNVVNPGGDYSSVVLADNPVGYWRLNQTVTTDLSVCANLGSLGAAGNGTYFLGVAGGQPGAIWGDADPAANFNGTQGRMDVPYDAELNPPVFSVELWAQLHVNPGSSLVSPLTSRASGGSRGYYFFVQPGSGKWQFLTGQGSGNDVMVGPSALWNQWAHLVGTYDGTNKAFYVNGVLVTNRAVAFLPASATPFRVGASSSSDNSPSLWFPGNLDEVAVYSHALSPDRVLAHYTTGAGIWLKIQQTSTNRLVIWNGGSLQQAGQVSGPWTDLNSASPVELGPTLDDAMFYRVKHP